jgi:hypothetical protein
MTSTMEDGLRIECRCPSIENDHPLARIRAWKGWSYQNTARIIAHRAQVEFGITLAAQRQKVWRWEHRAITPDRIAQLALAAELAVPAAAVSAQPWPRWLSVDGPTACAIEIASLQRQLSAALEALGGDRDGTSRRPDRAQLAATRRATEGGTEPRADSPLAVLHPHPRKPT